ncbi:MAG: lysozyme family protein [Eubacteriales bacterium]|nr:lysozyme family protein [Eubacteriales bacterium]
MAVGREERERQVRLQKIGIAAAVGLAVLLLLWAFQMLPFQKGRAVGLSPEVEQHRETVEAYCAEYGISGYSELVLAIMQQESAGQVVDVMQCSESPFNTLYARTPGSIGDTDYSIRVGVETFAYCLEEAGCKSPRNKKRLKLAIQQYNYGNDYAEWAMENYGGYSLENAQEYAGKMMAVLGWSQYGDAEYVTHVLRYYRMGW